MIDRKRAGRGHHGDDQPAGDGPAGRRMQARRRREAAAKRGERKRTGRWHAPQNSLKAVKRRGKACSTKRSPRSAAMIARNPVLVGGSTAFLVALSYVSANAIWYQPHFLMPARFSRPASIESFPRAGADEQETTIRIVRQREPRPRPKSDPVVEQVQAHLEGLDFYDGAVDGITGPNTRKAIAAYQQKIGHRRFRRDRQRSARSTAAPRQTASTVVPHPAPRRTPRPQIARLGFGRQMRQRRHPTPDDHQDPGRVEGIRQ